MTHWLMRSLARVARERGIVPYIAHSTVSLILRHADLQPHRYRYWKTPTLDEAFRHRAARILWCYERAQRLAQRDEWVTCLDEKPSIQALERRRPMRLVKPGQIERQEFEYLRHGTVNFLVALIVHNGQMHGWCLEHNDSRHLCEILPPLFEHYPKVHRFHLIWDNGASHIAHNTHRFLRQYDRRVRVLFTPAHASWPNQAELLIGAFAERYLKRGQWRSRQQIIEHLDASGPEYNRLHAHPFTWSWTRRQMHKWVDRHQ